MFYCRSGPFPIKVCQKSDQDPVIRGRKFKLLNL